MPFKGIFRKKSEASRSTQRAEPVERPVGAKDEATAATADPGQRPKQNAPYERKKRVLSKPPEVLNELLYRESGTCVDRFAPGRKPQEVCLYFNTRTFLISWFAGTVKGKPGTQLGQGVLVLMHAHVGFRF